MCRIWIFPVACFCVGAIALSGAATHAPKPQDKAPKKVTKEDVKGQMIVAHRGEKSPLARTEAELKKDAPNWEQLGKDAKEFVKMADLLKMGPPSYTDATKYISSTADFEKAATGKDTKKALEALTGLRKSCSACHYGIPK